MKPSTRQSRSRTKASDRFEADEKAVEDNDTIYLVSPKLVGRPAHARLFFPGGT